MISKRRNKMKMILTLEQRDKKAVKEISQASIRVVEVPRVPRVAINPIGTKLITTKQLKQIKRR